MEPSNKSAESLHKDYIISEKLQQKEVQYEGNENTLSNTNHKSKDLNRENAHFHDRKDSSEEEMAAGQRPKLRQHENSLKHCPGALEESVDSLAERVNYLSINNLPSPISPLQSEVFWNFNSAKRNSTELALFSLRSDSNVLAQEISSFIETANAEREVFSTAESLNHDASQDSVQKSNLKNSASSKSFLENIKEAYSATNIGRKVSKDESSSSKIRKSISLDQFARKKSNESLHIAEDRLKITILCSSDYTPSRDTTPLTAAKNNQPSLFDRIKKQMSFAGKPSTPSPDKSSPKMPIILKPILKASNEHNNLRNSFLDLTLTLKKTFSSSPRNSLNPEPKVNKVKRNVNFNSFAVDIVATQRLKDTGEPDICALIPVSFLLPSFREPDSILS